MWIKGKKVLYVTCKIQNDLRLLPLHFLLCSQNLVPFFTVFKSSNCSLWGCHEAFHLHHKPRACVISSSYSSCSPFRRVAHCCFEKQSWTAPVDWKERIAWWCTKESLRKSKLKEQSKVFSSFEWGNTMERSISRNMEKQGNGRIWDNLNMSNWKEFEESSMEVKARHSFTP